MNSKTKRDIAKESIEKWFKEIEAKSERLNEDEFCERIFHLRGGVGMAYLCALITPDEYSKYYDRITWITSSYNGFAHVVLGANVPDEP